MLPSKRCPGRYDGKTLRPAILSYGRLSILLLATLPLFVGCPTGGGNGDIEGPDSSLQGSVSGRVTVDGEGLAGVRVRLIVEGGSPFETVTDANGAYSIIFTSVGTLDGTVTIDQIPSGIFCSNTSQMLEVPEGEQATVNFECFRST